MIKKIIFSALFLCMCIAIPLAILGIKKVELGTPFLAFMKACSKDLHDYKIAIPNIPNIPTSDALKGAWEIIGLLIKFFNFIINICNIAISVMNVVIQLLEFIVLMVKNLITLKDTLAQYQIPVQPGW